MQNGRFLARALRLELSLRQLQVVLRRLHPGKAKVVTGVVLELPLELGLELELQPRPRKERKRIGSGELNSERHKKCVCGRDKIDDTHEGKIPCSSAGTLSPRVRGECPVLVEKVVS